jgi:hypothetical protein
MKWTKQEIEEYKKKSIEYYNNRGGYIPVNEHDKEDTLWLHAGEPDMNVRYSLAKEYLSFIYDFVEPDKEYNVWGEDDKITGIYLGEPCFYDKYLGPMDKPAPILGINLQSPLEDNIIGVRLIYLIPVNKTDDGRIYPNGDINKFLYNIVTKSEPYATLKEIIDSLVSYIGNKEIYFTSHECYCNGKKVSYFNCDFVKVFKPT